MLVCIGESARDVEGWDVNCWQATEPFLENTAEWVRGLTVPGGSMRRRPSRLMPPRPGELEVDTLRSKLCVTVSYEL
jgi:hypothetical protein